MSSNPEEITAEMLPQWAQISDAEIVTDIADTEREIRSGMYLSPAVREREEFVAFLRRLQTARVEADHDGGDVAKCTACGGLVIDDPPYCASPTPTKQTPAVGPTPEPTEPDDTDRNTRKDVANMATQSLPRRMLDTGRRVDGRGDGEHADCPTRTRLHHSRRASHLGQMQATRGGAIRANPRQLEVHNGAIRTMTRDPMDETAASDSPSLPPSPTSPEPTPLEKLAAKLQAENDELRRMIVREHARRLDGCVCFVCEDARQERAAHV